MKEQLVKVSDDAGDRYIPLSTLMIIIADPIGKGEIWYDEGGNPTPLTGKVTVTVLEPGRPS
jgi:hypothetical protein